jgi:hypothetical protein
MDANDLSATMKKREPPRGQARGIQITRPRTLATSVSYHGARPWHRW